MFGTATGFDATGFVCEDDTDAIIRATVAIGVSLDTPEDDPERRIAIINYAGCEIGNVPIPGLRTKNRPNKVVPLLGGRRGIAGSWWARHRGSAVN